MLAWSQSWRTRAQSRTHWRCTLPLTPSAFQDKLVRPGVVIYAVRATLIHVEYSLPLPTHVRVMLKVRFWPGIGCVMSEFTPSVELAGLCSSLLSRNTPIVEMTHTLRATSRYPYLNLSSTDSAVSWPVDSEMTV